MCLDKSIEKYEKRNFKGFDTFIATYKAMWVVKKEGNKWRDATCTCPQFLKHYICKHIVGIASRLKYIKIISEAKNVPIGEKRKRGRPRKATRALVKD